MQLAGLPESVEAAWKQKNSTVMTIMTILTFNVDHAPGYVIVPIC